MVIHKTAHVPNTDKSLATVFILRLSYEVNNDSDSDLEIVSLIKLLSNILVQGWDHFDATFANQRVSWVPQ